MHPIRHPAAKQPFPGAIALCAFVVLAVMLAAPAWAERMMIQTRAGVSGDARRQMIADMGGVEVGRIDALDVSFVEVPERRARSARAAAGQSALVQTAEPDSIAQATTLPADPLLASQWGVERINAPAVWGISGGSGVLIAVVDSGIDAGHADLTGVVSGYDFVNDDADASDDNGHGTQMAGVIAAAANGVGTVGVAYNSRVLPVKVLGADGTGPYSAIAQGIVFAADRGAQIINLSLGGTVASDVLQSAVDYALARGAVVVAAAGNSGVNEPLYPAACRGVLAVTASDSSDLIATFSNWGSWVAFTAPGVAIQTTEWRGNGKDYTAVSGTSPAAAFVSGAIGLLLPTTANDATAAVALLQESAINLLSAGWDPYSGAGRIDLLAAYRAAGGSDTRAEPSVGDFQKPQVSVLYPTKNMEVDGVVPVQVVATDNVGVVRVELSVNLGRGNTRSIATLTTAPFTVDWDTSAFAEGQKLIVMARAYDLAGNVKLSRKVKVKKTATALPVPAPLVRLSLPAAGDYKNPTAAVTSPVKRSVVSGLVAVDVAVADNVEVDHVELRVDKVPVAFDSSTPFGFMWDSGTVAPGRHKLSVTAYDTTGNFKESRAVVVTVRN